MSARDLEGFAKRLIELCEDLNIPVDRGRDTVFGRMFHVSPNAVRKWFLCEGMPELERAIEIANKAGVNVVWLLQGIGPKRPLSLSGQITNGLVEVLRELPDTEQRQVADFIRYRAERTLPPETRERLAAYLVER